MFSSYTVILFFVYALLIVAVIVLAVLLAVTLLTAIRAMRTFTRAQELRIDLLLSEKD
jgi:hypothetical protein